MEVQMMNGMVDIIVSMGLLDWLLILFLMLVAAATIKYLFFDREGRYKPAMSNIGVRCKGRAPRRPSVVTISPQTHS